MSNATIEATDLIEGFEVATPVSSELARRAREFLPSGISHDGWGMEPHPLYIDHAKGPMKWDVDGNSYVDYFGGHGALLLGHNNPAVVAALHAQLDRGTHFGACHEIGLRWASLVCEMIPSAERVRFTSSGTEATLLAVRIARAIIGRKKLLRIKGHFHGWHDHVSNGHVDHYDGTPTAGVLAGVADQVLIAEPNDEQGLDEMFERHPDIAAAIIEPTGGSWGRMPIRASFIRRLRELTAETGAILVFDEVVTGFRVSPGGAQAALGIQPDLTTLAKILAGGLPGGAVAGRRELMELLELDYPRRSGREKIQHPGTYNANPLSAAAGVATLEIIRDTDACERANRFGVQLRERLNEVVVEEGVPWAVYGTYSGFQVYADANDPVRSPAEFDAEAHIPQMLDKTRSRSIAPKIRIGMAANGVDINNAGAGVISAAHGPAELDRTAAAFRSTIQTLRREGHV